MSQEATTESSSRASAQEDLKSVAEPSDCAGARESDRDSSVRPPHGQVAVGTRPSDTGKAAHSGEERDMHLPRDRGIAKMVMLGLV